MLYIGIDPGESWCGFAALDDAANGVRVEARTYSIKAHDGYLRMTRDLLNLIPHNRPTQIICEDFRVRHSGHQRFSHGNTLRFIGALEYGTSMIDAFQFFLVPPNDHSEQETRELFGHVLFNYRKVWPRNRHAAWGHCLSAWRVLGNHLLQNNHELLISLRKQKRSHRSTQWLPISAARMPTEKYADHVAPAARWSSQGK